MGGLQHSPRVSPEAEGGFCCSTDSQFQQALGGSSVAWLGLCHSPGAAAPELELQQGCKGLSHSNPSAAHPLACPSALLPSIMWEPQGRFAALLFRPWQLSRVSAAQGSPEPPELEPSTSTTNLLGL